MCPAVRDCYTLTDPPLHYIHPNARSNCNYTTYPPSELQSRSDLHKTRQSFNLSLVNTLCLEEKIKGCKLSPGFTTYQHPFSYSSNAMAVYKFSEYFFILGWKEMTVAHPRNFLWIGEERGGVVDGEWSEDVGWSDGSVGCY